jgi:hypothetical protein
VFATPRAVRPNQSKKEQWKSAGWDLDWKEKAATAKPGTALKEIWNGAQVVALIHDSDSRKWYAFTNNQYFEVADPIKPRSHAIPIRRTWDAKQAIETAAKCGRVIRGIPELINK